MTSALPMHVIVARRSANFVAEASVMIASKTMSVTIDTSITEYKTAEGCCHQDLF